MAEIRPQFFLVRENNSIIPLIALDELPTDINIHGVPRNMNVTDTRGMTSVGTVPARGVYYVVEATQQSFGITEAKNESFTITPFNSKGKGRSYDKKNDGSPTGEKQPKVYCSYWIRTGECDFEQQGCRFKHVMPTDVPTLETIGLQDIPVWYREKHSIPSLRGRSRAGAAGLTQNSWRKPRATGTLKAVEYTSGNGNGNGATANTNSGVVGTVTPETSTGETIAETHFINDSLQASHRMSLNNYHDHSDNKTIAATNGSSPVTPPNYGRNIDFERVGTASFFYKYDVPQTPTGSGSTRSRRLYESQVSNHDYSTSPDSIPSMTHTVDSYSPLSSLGGTPRSPSQSTVIVKKNYAVAEDDINAADDTLDNLTTELAKFDITEPEYRSISELIDFSLPEDRYGNLILV